MNRLRARRFPALVLVLCLILGMLLTGCGGKENTDGEPYDLEGITYKETVPLQYADQFAIYRYEGGYSLIDMVNSDRILVVPEGKEVPEGLDKSIVVVKQPLDHIYLAATSAMALFTGIDALDSISYVGSKEWYTPEAIEAFEKGVFVYAGKYSAPDYETLLNGGCQLAIESTMIFHSPEVKEKLNELGIKVMVERSSYEEHPLGRTEWLKIYGTLLGREAEAEAVFQSEVDKVKALEGIESTGKVVAFFYISSSGNAVTYKTNGYVPAMIRIAGGEYNFTDLGLDDESKLSTVNMNMEQFFAAAKDADIVIYNCSIVSQLHTMDDFLSLNPVLEDLKAVKENNVWCTTESMFQQTDKMGTIIGEMNKIFTGQAEDGSLTYLFRLQ